MSLFWGGGILKAEPLPSPWWGRWKGSLLVWGERALESTPMSIEILPILPPTVERVQPQPIQQWQWNIQYGDQPVRRYTLIEVDRQSGLYWLDEGQGVRFEERFVHGILFSQIEIEGQRLQFQVELQNDRLVYTCVVFGESPRASPQDPLRFFEWRGFQRGSLMRTPESWTEMGPLLP